MAVYMVSAVLPELTEEMINLIPAHRARVNQHMLKNRIIGYTLALDRSRLWIVIQTNSLTAADDIVQSLPLAPYFEYTIHETAFHEAMPTNLAVISQN